MIAGKIQGMATPTAIGTLLNASTYGATIPTIYGTVRSAVLAMWAANIRNGGSDKKAKKKGVQTYVENIDFLIGSNPIEGVLQAWANNNVRYPLNFVKLTANFDADTYTIVDSNFYMLVAVTVNVSNSGIFNDYGADYGPTGIGAITSAIVADTGTGFAIGDTFNINGGSSGTGHVTAIYGSGTGPVAAIAIDNAGSGYSAGTVTCTATLGSGTLLEITIAVGGASYSDASEYSLFNVVQQGPDLIDSSYQKFWPWIYKWAVADGPTVTFPSFSAGWIQWPNAYPAGGTPNINFYYAQLSSATKFQTPLARLRLTFEPVLGDGSEYGSAYASQRILYPQYAGVGSPNFDLGAAGMIPDLRLEVKGSFARFGPSGDADFSDMIEDTIKSGMLQVGSELGLIQRGVNANEMPGPVQKLFYTSLAFGSPITRNMSQPIAAGDILIVGASYRAYPTETIGLTDGAANSWTPITNQYGGGLFYATANANTPAGNAINISESGGDSFDPMIMALEMDPGSTVVDNTASASGSGTTASCSITVSGSPTYIIAFIQSQYEANVTGIPVHWTDLFPNGNGSGYARMAYRIVAAPGTYTFKVNLSSSGYWNMGMIALKAAQPVPYPKALGNIIDLASLNTVRAQCQANGLWGSVSMNAQQAASDWLKQFYQCANASPVWSGFVLKSIANSEVSTVGNGIVYVSPTASGPKFNFTMEDFVGGANKPPVVITRKAQVDSWDIAQLQFYDRSNDYNQALASEPLTGAVALFGPRKQNPVQLPMITSPTVARLILTVIVNRYTLLRNKLSFTLKARCLGVEAKDLVTIPEPNLWENSIPVMMTSVKENDNGELECIAEPFIYGANAPDLTAGGQSPSPNNPNSSYTPVSVNTPIIFEPPPRMWASATKPELWIAVSDSDTNYGGSIVSVSTDGGSTYNTIGTIRGNATTGVSTADWPIAADPDTTNNLPVDLTESNGILASYSTTDEDEFTYPCYIAGGTTNIPYELMTYAVATLTATSKYTLEATGGNHLRRSVYGAPTVGEGVDHPSGSRFLFIGQAPVGATRPGFLIVPFDPSWVGKTLHFEFQAFNALGGGAQDASGLTAYSYTPAGTVGTGNSNWLGYKISGGALTNPTSTSIAMAQATATWQDSHQSIYNARSFTIPAPSTPTTYYVTIYDPAMLGDNPGATNLSAQCQTSNANVGVAGYVYIGAITALPAGSGTQSGSGGAPVGLTVPIENETHTGITGTTITLNNTPSTAPGYTQVRGQRNGVRMNPGAGNDFTWSGSTVTLATAAVSADVFIFDYWSGV